MPVIFIHIVLIGLVYALYRMINAEDFFHLRISLGLISMIEGVGIFVNLLTLMLAQNSVNNINIECICYFSWIISVISIAMQLQLLLILLLTKNESGKIFDSREK